MNPAIIELLKERNLTIESLNAENIVPFLKSVSEHIDLIENKNSKLQNFIELNKNVTKSEISGQLRKQRLKFVSILNSMSDGLCVIDEIGTITFANFVAEKLLNSRMLIGENLYDLVDIKNEANSSVLASSSIDSRTKSQILNFNTRVGTTIPLKSSWSELRDEENNHVGQVIVFNDCTLELETNRLLEQARDRAVEMSKLKSEFLATMSHEIRTPLNGIISLVSLLELSDLNDEQKEDVKDLGASANQLLSIISNVLDLSKIEAGKMYLDYQKFSLQNLLNDITRIFNSQMQEKDILFFSEIIGDSPNYILADYTRLKQVLVNLISNSYKFTGKSGSIVLLIKSKLNHGNNYSLEFCVIDTGVGVPSTILPNLFDPFVQADGSITTHFGGTGLGLSICKNLVDLMGGTIHVRSLEGVGSVFSFNLIVEEPIFSHESLSRLKSVKKKNYEQTSREAVVLVVDDNPINLSTTTRYLKKHGLTTISAKSGDEALEISSQGNIDLILLDLHLPTMSGYEVTRCIRDSDLPVSKVPILAVTANVLQGTEKACLDAGFDGFVPKPLNLLELVKSIDLILGKNNLQSQSLN